MKFLNLIVFSFFVSFNANSQRTICTLESKPSWSDEMVVSAFCLNPLNNISQNEWFIPTYKTDGVFLGSTISKIADTHSHMEIDEDNIVGIYQGNGEFSHTALALQFLSYDRCVLTPLKCEICIDDFEQSVFIGGRAHDTLTAVYHSNPRLDFTIDVTEGEAGSNRKHEFQLKRFIYRINESKGKKNGLDGYPVIWEYVGKGPRPSYWGGLKSEPMIEVEVKSDSNATYYFLTRGMGDLFIVKITKKGKEIRVYESLGGCYQRFYNQEMIETCCVERPGGFLFKK